MKSKQQGFTLVELVVVIVILGILAATALPRFINVSTDARIAAVQGAAGGVRAAVAVVQARYFATGNMAATSVTMADGTAVAVTAATGVPTGATGGIGNAMGSCTTGAGGCQGLTAVFATGTNGTTFTPSGGSATCQAQFSDNTGAVIAVVTGC